MTLILCAIFLGSLIGELTAGSENFSWLSKSYDIGISAFDLDLKIIVLTLGCEFRICIAQVFLILAALISYPKLASSFFS